MDRYVLDVPWPLRRLIVSAFILPFRPRRSAEAYAAIWDHAGPGTGSPLLHYSRNLEVAARAALNMPCELAMRYGEPSLERRVEPARSPGVDELLLVPLYPQFADSTCTTTIRAVQKLVGGRMTLHVLTPFYARPDYISALARTVQEHLPGRGTTCCSAITACPSGTSPAPTRPAGTACSRPTAAIARPRPTRPATGTSACEPPSGWPRCCRCRAIDTPSAFSHAWAGCRGSRPIPTRPWPPCPVTACAIWWWPAPPSSPTTSRRWRRSACRAGRRFLPPAATATPWCPA
jgi:hypothetical protein